MKIVLIQLIIVVCSLQLIAQMNISTNLRQDFVYDNTKEEWNVSFKNEDELTFFEFNKDFTMFKHTTSTMTSAYIIKSSKEDKERNQFELDIISDIGNKYLMLIDFKDNNVRFIYEKDSIMYMVHHTIKKVWFDDEN